LMEGIARWRQWSTEAIARRRGVAGGDALPDRGDGGVSLEELPCLMEAIARRRGWAGIAGTAGLIDGGDCSAEAKVDGGNGRRRQLLGGGNCSMEAMVNGGNRSTEGRRWRRCLAQRRRWRGVAGGAAMLDGCDCSTQAMGGNCRNSRLSQRRRLLGGSQGRRRQLLDGGNGQRRQSLDGGASLEEMPCPT